MESNPCPGKQLCQWIIKKTTPSLSLFQHKTSCQAANSAEYQHFPSQRTKTLQTVEPRCNSTITTFLLIHMRVFWETGQTQRHFPCYQPSGQNTVYSGLTRSPVFVFSCRHSSSKSLLINQAHQLSAKDTSASDQLKPVEPGNHWDILLCVSKKCFAIQKKAYS